MMKLLLVWISAYFAALMEALLMLTISAFNATLALLGHMGSVWGLKVSLMFLLTGRVPYVRALQPLSKKC